MFCTFLINVYGKDMNLSFYSIGLIIREVLDLIAAIHWDWKLWIHNPLLNFVNFSHEEKVKDLNLYNFEYEPMQLSR